MKVEYLSASRIKTFEQCQLQYHAVYDLKFPDKNSHHLTFMGSAVHKMLEISTNALRLGKHERLYDPRVLRDSACRKYNVIDSDYKLVDQLVENALEWGYLGNIENNIGCELEFLETLSDGKTKIRGFIDRLDIKGGNANIIDIKTQKRAFTESQLINNIQARVYNIALRKLEDVDKVKVSFWVLRHRVQSVNLTVEDAIKDEQMLIEKAREIRTCENPTATKTALCEWCRYKDECSAYKSGIKSTFKWGKK